MMQPQQQYQTQQQFQQPQTGGGPYGGIMAGTGGGDPMSMRGSLGKVPEEGTPPRIGGYNGGGINPGGMYTPQTGGNTPLPFTNNQQQPATMSMPQQQQPVGRAATNPEMAAYYNSIAQQDAQLASQADAYGRERTNYGIGLLGAGVNTAQQGFGLQQAALSPWSSYFGAANQIEGAGQGAMDLATALGAQQSTAGANQGRYLSAAGQQYNGSALGSGLMGLAGNRQFTSGLGNWLGGSWGSSAAGMGLGSVNPVSGEYMGSLEF